MVQFNFFGPGGETLAGYALSSSNAISFESAEYHLIETEDNLLHIGNALSWVERGAAKLVSLFP